MCHNAGQGPSLAILAALVEHLEARLLTVLRVLAVVRFGEYRWLPLLAPDLLAGTLRMLSEMSVALPEVSVDRHLGVVDGWVVAVVYDGARHTAEYGLDDI